MHAKTFDAIGRAIEGLAVLAEHGLQQCECGR